MLRSLLTVLLCVAPGCRERAAKETSAPATAALDASPRSAVPGTGDAKAVIIASNTADAAPGAPEPTNPLFATRRLLRQIASKKQSLSALADPERGALVVTYITDEADDRQAIHACGRQLEDVLAPKVSRIARIAENITNGDDLSFLSCRNKPEASCVAAEGGELMTAVELWFSRTDERGIVLELVLERNHTYRDPGGEAAFIAKHRARLGRHRCQGDRSVPP